jgi:muconolactone D-isomerase
MRYKHGGVSMEFLVRHEFSFPDHVNRDKVISEERAMAADLGRDGKLERLWRDPLQKATWSIWNVNDTDELHSIFAALPAFPYFLNLTVHPLASHPADPGVRAP